MLRASYPAVGGRGNRIAARPLDVAALRLFKHHELSKSPWLVYWRCSHHRQLPSVALVMVQLVVAGRVLRRGQARSMLLWVFSQPFSTLARWGICSGGGTVSYVRP